MSCAACDSLKARAKTCWRHPQIQPQSMGLEKLAPGPMFSPPRPGPSYAQRATLDALFPAHVTHSKWALPIVSLGFRFACDCATELSYYYMSGGVTVPLPEKPVTPPTP